MEAVHSTSITASSCSNQIMAHRAAIEVRELLLKFNIGMRISFGMHLLLCNEFLSMKLNYFSEHSKALI